MTTAAPLAASASTENTVPTRTTTEISHQERLTSSLRNVAVGSRAYENVPIPGTNKELRISPSGKSTIKVAVAITGDPVTPSDAPCIRIESYYARECTGEVLNDLLHFAREAGYFGKSEATAKG